MDEIKKYIEQQKANGASEEEIKKGLINSGHSEGMIQSYFTTQAAPPPPPMSQTGVLGSPIQVENVQYNVDAKDYKSKPALIFQIANFCLALGLLTVAIALYDLTGGVFGFADSDVANTLQVAIALLLPTGVIGFIAMKRLRTLLEERPEAIEDIKFKSHLRKSFIFFLLLTGLMSFVAIFSVLGVLFGTSEEHPMDAISYALYFAGGLIIQSLWLYSLQKRTTR